MKNLFLLGATGSIGTQVLDVIRNQEDFCLKSISVGKNIPSARKIIAEFHPEFVSCLNYEDMIMLKSEFPNIGFGFGNEGLRQAAVYSDEDGFVINAVVGMVGLIPTMEAIRKKRTILLANKETLVVAGDIIKRMATEYNVKIIPIDSEHSAIHQCLLFGNRSDVSKIIITASGGSFRNRTRAELTDVTAEDALRHPNWLMGPKITIDSATMVNKGLEVIEAHFLFDLDYDQIETILHPESIIHSMVEFRDRSIIAQMAIPDMRIPIQYALTYPEKRMNPQFRTLDLAALKTLSFFRMDLTRFPMLALAYQVGRQGGIMPAVYNAANEEAVSLFLRKRISFLDIEAIIGREVGNASNIINPTFEEILRADHDVRNRIKNQYEVK